MSGSFGNQLKACGRKGLPRVIRLNANSYDLIRVFKHDFFAATALYQIRDMPDNMQDTPSRVVLKIGREDDFMGLPLHGLGQWLCRHEWSLLKRLQHLDQTPRLVARYNQNGFIYAYIEGRSLDEKPVIPDSFFSRLEKLVDEIHRQNIAYIDMNKRGNILIGDDQRPYLIDFQIACHLPCHFWLIGRVFRRILTMLQNEDRYHLNKHKRRFRPDLLNEQQAALSRKFSVWIAVHRITVDPLRRLRRTILGWLYHKGQLSDGEVSCLNPENDPSRWRRNSE